MNGWDGSSFDMTEWQFKDMFKPAITNRGGAKEAAGSVGAER